MTAYWPNNIKRSRLLAAFPEARAIRQSDVRDRWVPVLRDEVVAAKLPYASVLASFRNPLSLLSIVAPFAAESWIGVLLHDLFRLLAERLGRTMSATYWFIVRPVSMVRSVDRP